MSTTKKGFSSLFLGLLLILLCIPAAMFGESTEEAMTQEILVSNTPIKGQIVLEKKGMVLTGFVESTDSTGYTVYTPDYHEGYLEGAVYEVRAVEDITGREGTKWFSANEIAATIETSANGKVESPLLPLGHYYITEKTAPTGYALDEKRYDVLLEAKDQKTPVVIESINVTDDFLPARINFSKVKQIIVSKEDSNGLVSSTTEYTAGEGFVFGLFNYKDINYNGGTLPANSLVAVAVTDADGKGTFSGNFPHGHYTLKELAAPDGWKVNPVAYRVDIDRKYLNNEGICEFTYETPIVDEIVHGNPQIAKLNITGSEYLPNTLIEVKNEEGKIVCRAYTTDDGFVPTFPALPGKYTYREVLAPEGYELCVTEFSFVVTDDGIIEGSTAVSDDFTRFYVLKVDESNKPLAGVEFGLYTENGELKRVATSDDRGMAVFEKVPYGTYFIQEKTPLPGYRRDYTRIPVSIDGKYVNPKEPLAVIDNCPTEIILKKVDQNGSNVAGAEFGLYNDSGKLVMTTKSDGDGVIHFSHVEDGTYTVREITAPAGYLASRKSISITVDENYQNPAAPTQAFVNIPRQIQLKKVDTSGKAIAGIEFALINATTGEIVENVKSARDGSFTFTKFDYGDWIIRELSTPEGFCKMTDITIHVDDEWKSPDVIQCVNIPNYYTFMKTDSSGNPLSGVKFRLEDASGKEIATYVSDEKGIVRITDLESGVYYIREIETLEGFSLSGEVIKLTLDEHYVIPEEMPHLVNYTVIQTGVHMAVTGVMILGAVFATVSCILFIIKKKKTSAKKEN